MDAVAVLFGEMVVAMVGGVDDVDRFRLDVVDSAVEALVRVSSGVLVQTIWGGDWFLGLVVRRRPALSERVSSQSIFVEWCRDASALK